MARWRDWLTGAYTTAGIGLVAAGLVWVMLYAAIQPIFEQAEERAGDLAWRLGADRSDERRVVVIDIDERSLKEIGMWPWPRATQARLVELIAAAGARQQIFDVVFAGAGREAEDDQLARAVDWYQPVGAQLFAIEQPSVMASGHLVGALNWQSCPEPFEAAQGYLANFKGFPARLAGHITPRVDADGIVRRQPAVICYGGRSYPALGVAALMSATGAADVLLERGASPLDPAWKLVSAAFPRAIPLNERGDLRLSWLQHPDAYVSISAADLLAGRMPAGLVEGAWVLVGSSAFGMNDTIGTPYGGANAGFLAHLQLMTAMVDGRVPFTPLVAPWLQIGAALGGVVVLVTLAGVPASRRKLFPVYLLPIAAAAWAGLLWTAHALLLIHASLWIGWVAPVVFVLLAGSAMGIAEHARSRIVRDQLYAHLSSYLPAPVAAALALQPPSNAIKAATRQISVMFADIRNFSAYCEVRPPEEAAAVLHAFFSTATRIVEAHGGVIEAFQGDAVFAVWNADADATDPPRRGVADPAHGASHALAAAVDLLAAVQGVLPDPAPDGLEPLSLGVGVETGPAMAGSFGLARRRAHTVLGRTVTIASRLVEMTAELAHPILVGEGLAAQVGTMHLESMGTFLLEGLRVPHHIYAYPLAAARGGR